jgi:hypothetical protein
MIWPFYRKIKKICKITNKYVAKHRGFGGPPWVITRYYIQYTCPGSHVTYTNEVKTSSDWRDLNIGDNYLVKIPLRDLLKV